MTAFRQRIVYLLVIFNILPHFGEVPSWIPMFGLIFVTWRWLSDLIKIPVPGRWITAGLATLCAAGVWAEFHRIVDDQAAVALLLLMVALKTFEIRGYRDVMFVTYLCLLLLMGKLLGNQSLPATIYMLIDVVLILSLMNLFHTPKGSIYRSPIRGVIRLLLQSSPILILLFVVFPRFHLRLFSPVRDTNATVGFSPRVTPGSVAQLLNSDAIAFRAFFSSGVIAPYSELYWRGAVLNHANGLNWDQKDEPVEPRTKSLLNGEKVEVTPEPSLSRWLFTLDWPLAINIEGGAPGLGLVKHAGLTYESGTSLMSGERYSFFFNSNSADVHWEGDPKAYLRVEGDMPETRKLVAGWIGRNPTPAQLISRAKTFFDENSFAYTLQPGTVSSVDEFLFKSKRGYCEHFAAATATFFRLSGIPARVVVGYQGGEPSLMGDYLIVRQQDAHAWVEYWSESEQAWMRLDPTMWIAPERIQLGARRYMERTAPGDLVAKQFPLVGRFLSPKLLSWLTRGQLMKDQAEVFWVNFLLHYDFDFQKSLFAKLGFEKISKILLAVVTLVVLVLSAAVAFALIRLRQRKTLDPMLKMYRELCERLARQGLVRHPGEGPLNYGRRAIARFPNQAEELREIFGLYIDARYANGFLSDRDFWKLRARIHNLRQITDPKRTA